jgi:hypothetical protein
MHSVTSGIVSADFVRNIKTSPNLADSVETILCTKLTLIGGGFSDSLSYLLTINGTLQNGAVFDYTKQVQITAP